MKNVVRQSKEKRSAVNWTEILEGSKAEEQASKLEKNLVKNASTAN